MSQTELLIVRVSCLIHSTKWLSNHRKIAL